MSADRPADSGSDRSERGRPSTANGGRYRRFRGWQILWAVAIWGVPALAAYFYQMEIPDEELLYVVWFVGFLLGVELLAPRHVASDLWRKLRLRWIVFGGSVVVAFIVLEEVLEVVA